MQVWPCLVVLLVASVVVSSAIESPPYTVTKDLNSGMEIRKYNATKWVSTQKTGIKCMQMQDMQSDMFWKLYGYITGKNNQNKKIEMTAPVVSMLRNYADATIDANSVCNFTMCFYVPLSDQANTPQPTASDVFLKQLTPVTVATIRYSWYPSMKDHMANRDKLIEKLGADAANYDTHNVVIAGYDSPMKFWSRRNELWLVKKQ